MKDRLIIKLVLCLLLGIVLVGLNTGTQLPGTEIGSAIIENYNC